MSEEKVLKNGKKYENEKLICIDKNHLKFKGIFNTIPEEFFSKIPYEVLDRNDAEWNTDVIQLVANVLLISKIDNKYKFGVLKRYSNYTESSLNCTVGMIGGHVNIDDTSIYNACIREVFEEINAKQGELNIIPKGLIYLPSNDDTLISNYHVCCFYIAEIDNNISNIKCNEDNQELIWLEENKDFKLYKNEVQCKYKLDSWLEIAMTNIILNRNK